MPPLPPLPPAPLPLAPPPAPAAHRFRKRGLAVVPTKFGISFTTKFLNQAGALVHIYTGGWVGGWVGVPCQETRGAGARYMAGWHAAPWPAC